MELGKLFGLILGCLNFCRFHEAWIANLALLKGTAKGYDIVVESGRDLFFVTPNFGHYGIHDGLRVIINIH